MMLTDLTPVPLNTVASIISIHSFIAFMRTKHNGDSTSMLRSRQCDIIDWDACAGSFLSHCAGVPSFSFNDRSHFKQPLFNEHIVFTLNHNIGLYPNAGQ